MEIIYIVVILGVVLVWLVASYNRLVTLRNRVKGSWSDIEVQLKRRYDLIPNLVSTVKGYVTHESTVLDTITKARAQAMGAPEGVAKAGAENMLTGALKSLFAVAEAYPNLKADANFGKLQDELTDTEDKIQAARRFYNSTVLELNTKVETFPSSLIAQSFGFKQEVFFDAEPEADKPVEVKF